MSASGVGTVRELGIPATGVTHASARERAARIADLRYALSFAIPSERTERVAGHATISFTLREHGAPLVLDFNPNRMGALHCVDVGGAAVEADQINGHIVVPPAALRAGKNTIAIDFDAGDAPLNRTDDCLYTIFVPARAHEAFPCFDQPDLKARWTLVLDVPSHWETLANSAEIGRESAAGRTRVTFAETAPLSTYLFAFAAGEFIVEESERDGRAFRMVHRETDARLVADNRDAIYALHRSALHWLERYTGIAYPFDKFDFLLLPAFQFGGMEHPGAVFYNAASLLLAESASHHDRLARASLIAHETAHMWFGNLVTMTWFDDVWMKEVFANLMAAQIVASSFPDANHDLRFLHTHYPRAYDVDRTAGTNAIRQPLENLSDAGTLYGAIIYHKAPIVMRQLERILGSDAFRDAVREYFQAFQFGNAAWPDLLALFSARTGADLAAWSHAWIDEAGRPIVRTEMTVSDGRISRLAFISHDADSRRGLTWTQDLQVALGDQDEVRLVPARFEGGRAEVIAARGRAAPLFVLPNGGGEGYGEFRLDPPSLAWLSRQLPEIADALTRGSAWAALWDSLLSGALPSSDFLDLVIAALPRETDELNVHRLLSSLEQAYWIFTNDDARRGRASGVERVLRAGLVSAASPAVKGAYFRALQAVASTPETVDWLTRVWQGDQVVPGLELAESDFIDLALALGVRNEDPSHNLLDLQITRTKNPDRKARLGFIAPALSADPTDRDRFFASLTDLANRRHEPWVLDGVRHLHHPLRAASAIHYLEPALGLLPELQRTGDLFFPMRWLAATLGGHRSSEAATVVHRFLDCVPSSYPEHLRRIILTSADALFRACGPLSRR